MKFPGLSYFTERIQVSVGWRELAACAAWLALGAVMTWILAKPRQPQY
jgi:hypothetical protein